MKHILVVDDNKISLASAKLALQDNYKITAVTSGAQALNFLERSKCDLILLDINMPEMDGFELIGRIKSDQRYANIPVIFLTAYSNSETEKKCLDSGAMDFVSKPFIGDVMRARIARILELKDLQLNLEEKLHERTRHILRIQRMMILGLASMVESRDTGTGEHIKRTSSVIEIFAKKLFGYRGLARDFLNIIVRAAPMHDLGKIAVNDAVLRKNGKFTEEEYTEMKKHASEGARVVRQILEGVEEERFVVIAENIAHYHHEKWDGTGYPDGLKGDSIPVEARIMALADVFDALVSKRVYKEAFPFGKAFEIIQDSLGSHFDPKLGEIFISCRPDLESFYHKEFGNGGIIM